MEKKSYMDEDYKDLIDFSSPAMQERLKLPDNKFSEVIYGELYVWPSVPGPDHQYVLGTLLVEIRTLLKENDTGYVLHGPIDLYLTEGSEVITPDLVYWSLETNVIVDDYGLIGTPDLIIEVLSRYTCKRDLTIKKFLYAGAGVKEYWIIDPITKDSWGYLLETESTMSHQLQTPKSTYEF